MGQRFAAGWVVVMGAALAACSGAPLAARAPAAQAPAAEPVVEPASKLEASVERGLLPAVLVEGEPVERRLLAERMAALKVPGLSVAVFDEGGVVWAKGYGVTDVETGGEVDPGTLFQAGSISKSVNALAILLAAAGGSFGLDQPVNELLKTWKLPESELTEQAPVTLRRLLSHTAGTTVHGFPGYPSGAALPTLVDVLEGRPPANTPPVRVGLLPGSQFLYSGGGTTISQLVLLDQFPGSYPALMAERVLEPLGMSSSTYEQPLQPERLALAAAGHRGDGSGVPSKRYVYPEMAAAGLWTTPTELAVFFREVALARAGRSRKIPQSVALEMTTEVSTRGASGAETIRPGLGVFLQRRNGVGFFGHDGADAGFQATAIASLEGARGLVMMANSDNGMRLFPEVERTVLASMGWPGADAPVTRVALNEAERAAWVGVYVGPDGAPLSLRSEGERLLLVRPFRAADELVPLGSGRAVERTRGIRYSLAAGGLQLEASRGPLGTARRVPEGERVPLIELAEGRREEALRAWRAQVGPGGRPTPQTFGVYLHQAHELLAEGDAEAAVLIFGAITDVFPALPRPHQSLGQAQAAAGRPAEAARAFETALERLAGATWLPPGDRESLRRSLEAELAEVRGRAQ